MEFTNDEDRKQAFTVRIDDEDLRDGFIQSHELTLVDNSSKEWDHYIKHKPANCANALTKPVDPNQVNAANMLVKLDPGQEITILLKYQSLRQPIVSKKEGEVFNKSNDLLPRNIKVFVVD